MSSYPSVYNLSLLVPQNESDVDFSFDFEMKFQNKSYSKEYFELDVKFESRINQFYYVSVFLRIIEDTPAEYQEMMYDNSVLEADFKLKLI